MIICILIVAYLVLRAGWDKLPGGINLPHLTTMMVATLVNLVLVFIAFIVKPGGSGVGWEFGAFLGAHRGGRRRGAVRDSAQLRGGPGRGELAGVSCRMAASSSPGIFAADGSASKATNRRMTS